MLSTILVFVFTIGLLIFVHELGHFLTAKRAGIRVDEFAFGFPPRLISKKVGETRYSFNLFPVGGYVKIYGEEGQGKKDPRSFASKSVLVRAWIIASGVLMNLLLAAVLLSIGFMVGLPEVITDDQQIGQGAQVPWGEGETHVIVRRKNRDLRRGTTYLRKRARCAGECT